MTRDFNKNRNASRPPLRNPSSNRYGEAQPSRPARPRLNRASVDRAWETGASHHHADYRPRSSNGQARNQQRSEYSNSQGRPGGNRPYNPNRGDSRGFEQRSPAGDQGSRSFSERRDYDDQRTNHPRNYSNGPQRGPRGGNDYRQDKYEQPRRGEARFRDQEQPYRSSRPAGNNRAPQSGDRRPNTNRYGERDGGQERAYRRRPQENPRWQSRPWAQRPPRDDEPRQSAQFEGDYEYLNYDDRPRNNANHTYEDRPRNNANHTYEDRSHNNARHTHHDDERQPQQERHVTRLPDGRVLKGPRPVQRKNAQFWSEIGNDTEDLLNHVQPPEADALPTEDAEIASPGPEDLPTQKGSKRPSTARAKKTAGSPAKRGPKPSQRGFKWPAP